MKHEFAQLAQYAQHMKHEYAYLDPESGKVKTTNSIKIWGESFRRKDRIIQQDQLPNKVFISTVFLGIDHGFGGKPLWFETMIFGLNGDNPCRRYATRIQALKGHNLWLKRLESGITDPDAFNEK